MGRGGTHTGVYGGTPGLILGVPGSGARSGGAGSGGEAGLSPRGAFRGGGTFAPFLMRDVTLALTSPPSLLSPILLTSPPPAPPRSALRPFRPRGPAQPALPLPGHHQQVSWGGGGDQVEAFWGFPWGLPPESWASPRPCGSSLQLYPCPRSVLDFDFEKLCSISLSHINVYACLVCGKYFQGEPPRSCGSGCCLGDTQGLPGDQGAVKGDMGTPRGQDAAGKGMGDAQGLGYCWGGTQGTPRGQGAVRRGT